MNTDRKDARVADLREALKFIEKWWNCPNELRKVAVAALNKDDSIVAEENSISNKYDKTYDDDRVCECGHLYYRHFDTYEGMKNVGCKYCSCGHFVEAKPTFKHPATFERADAIHPRWQFERSSGYAGFRCSNCGVWIYMNEKPECDCGTPNNP